MPERSRKPVPLSPAPDKDPIAAELGRRGGIKGGRARAERLPPELRRAIAQRAAATRWASVRRDQANGAQQPQPQPQLPGTPRADAVGVLVLAGRPLQVVRTDTGVKLLGQLSLETVLGAPLKPDTPSVAYHVPGEWQLKRALTPETFAATLAEAATAAVGDGRTAAVELLAACAVAGLAPLIEDALAAAPAARPAPAAIEAALADG